MRKITIFILWISIVPLVACQQNELFDNETITSIKVQKWESGEEVNNITDELFINDLIEELESANSSSTANIDISNPEYRLVFLNKDRIIRELGYYVEEEDFNGTAGQIIDMEAGNHYGVTIDLQIDYSSNST